MLSKLPCELSGVHASAGGKLLNGHARLRLRLCVGRSKLLCRQSELCCLLGARKTKLARLQGPGLSELLCREAKLACRLSGLLTLRRQRLCVSRGLLRRTKPHLLCGQNLLTPLKKPALCQLFSRKPRLCRKLLCRKAKLTRSLGLLSRELLCRKP